MKKFRHDNLLSLVDFTKADYSLLFETAKELRKKHRDDWPEHPLERKLLTMIFEKRSTRTRLSFAAATVQLGGHFIELSESSLHVGEGHESIEDTARVVGSYSAAVVIRCYQQSKLELYAEHAGVPVINGLTDDLHPCQVLADLFTLHEAVGDLSGFRLSYVGRPNNVSNTLILGCATLGIELSLGFPDNFPWVHDKLQHFIRTSREKNGDTVRIEIHHDAAEAVKGANAVYTDTWFDTGMVFKDGEKVELVNRMKPFQVNSELMKKASPGAYFLHCLPAERGNEVVDEVMDDAQVSLVWKQVENRLHVQKAILALLVT